MTTFLAIIALLAGLSAGAQAAVLSPLPIQHFTDSNGVPLSGGKLFTYAAGTTTKLSTYTDATGSTPNTDPVILNARGEAPVWLQPEVGYKFVLSPATDTDPPTNPIWTIDGIENAGDTSGTISPISYGAVGNGTTDDTAAMVKAIAAAQAGNLPLRLGPYHYLITSALSDGGNYLNVLGNMTPLGVDVYATSCPAGVSSIIVNTDIDGFDFSGPSGSIAGVCFQMATTPGTRAAGAAINTGGTATTQQGHFTIAGNAILNPYDGIVIGGATTGTTQTNGDIGRDNLIINPSDHGIWVGAKSTGVSTNGTRLDNNQIACFQAYTNAVGIEFDDGGQSYEGGDGGPYHCNIGMKIDPGAGQSVLGNFTGLLGDSSFTNDLQITSAGGNVHYLRFTDWWASSTGNGNDTPIWVKDDAGGGHVGGNILFTGGQAHGGNIAGGKCIVQLDNDVFDVSFVGNHFAADGGGNSDHGICNNSSGNWFTAVGNSFKGQSGHLATGITLDGTGDMFVITGNNMGDTVLPFTGTELTLAGARGIIRDNQNSALVWQDMPIAGINACTGAGSTGSCALAPGSSGMQGVFEIAFGGSGIGTAGTAAFNPSGATPAHGYSCSFAPQINTGGIFWPAGSVFALPISTNTIEVEWNSNGVTPTSGDTYLISYSCVRM